MTNITNEQRAELRAMLDEAIDNQFSQFNNVFSTVRDELTTGRTTLKFAVRAALDAWFTKRKLENNHEMKRGVEAALAAIQQLEPDNLFEGDALKRTYRAVESLIRTPADPRATTLLDERDKDFLRLIARSLPYGEREWKQVSVLLWPMVERFPHKDLIETDPSIRRVRLSEQGQTVLHYLL